MAADGKIEIELEVKDQNAQQQGKKAGEEIAKGVEAGLKNVNKSADSAAKDMEKSFKSASDSAKSSFSDVGSAAKSGFSDVGDAARTAASDASSAFENVPSDASGAFSDVSSEAKAGFDGVADAANTAASDTAGAFDGVGDEIAADLESVDDKAQGIFGTNIPASTAIAGAAIGVLAGQVLEIGANAVQTGMEFDKSMAQVAATMGKSVDEVEELRDFAQEMGETTAFSASQSADALNYMALAGYDAETSMRVLPTVLNLAAAGSMDLAEASDMVTDAQSALGLSVDQAEVMVDQMAKASSKTNTSVSQLGNAFLTVGGTAKNLKGGTQELAQMLGILADNGVKGSEGGTALRNVILSLSAPTDKAAGAIKDLGLEVFDAAGNMRSMPEIFGDLNDAMADMTQQDRTNVLNDIFNKVDLKSVNALLGTSAERFDEVADAIDNSQGAAQQMADTQLDNLAGDVTLLESATEGFMIAVSDALTPALRGLTQFGTNTLIPFLTDAVKNFDKIAPYIAAAATALVMFVLRGKAIKTFGGIFSSLTMQVNGTTVAFKSMTVAQKMSAVATKTLKTAMNGLKAAGPLIALTAIAEIAAVIADKFAKDREHTQKLTKATSGLESAATNTARGIGKEADAFDDLGSSISNIDMDEFLDKHAELADSIKDTNQEASTNQAMLSDYAKTINELAGESDLTAPQVAELENAISRVNDALGTSYSVQQDAKGVYQIMADGAAVAKDNILDLIEAQRLQIRAEADLKNYQEVYSQWQSDLQDVASAKAKVEDATKKLGQAEQDAQKASNPVERAKASAAMAKYGIELENAKKDLEEIESTAGATASTMYRLDERTRLNTMAMDENASALVKNAEANEEFKSGVQSMAVKLDDFVVALEDMGFTAKDVSEMNQDTAMQLASAWGKGKDEMVKAAKDAGVEVPQKLKEMDSKAYDAAYGAGDKAGKGFAQGLSDQANTAVNNAAKTVGITRDEFDKAASECGFEGEDAIIAFASALSMHNGDIEAAASSARNALTGNLDIAESDTEQSGKNAIQGLINGVNAKLPLLAKAAVEATASMLQGIKKTGEEGSPWKTTYRSGVFAAQGLINGVKKGKKNAKKTASELSEAIVSAASNRISNLKGVYNISLNYEIGFWKKIKSQTKKGSDAWYKAAANVVKLKKQQATDLEAANNKIITNANKYLERYKITHELSVKAETNYWNRIIKKVKKGSDAYYEALKKIKSLKEQQAQDNAQKYNDIVSNAQTKLERQQITKDTTAKYEETYWKKVLAQVKKGTDAYYTALEKYVDAKKRVKEEAEKVDEETLSNAQTVLERRKLKNNVSAQDEADYWKAVLSEVKKGSDAYWEAYSNYKSAREQAADDLKDANAKILSDAETWLDHYKLNHSMTAEEEAKYWKGILSTVKKGTEEWWTAYANYKEAKNSIDAETVSEAEKSLERYKLNHTMSAAQEADFWRNMLKEVKKGSDEYYDVYSKYIEAKNRKDQETLNKANTYLERYKLTHNISIANEIKYWQKYLKKVKKGSDEYWEIYAKIIDLQNEKKEEVARKDDDILSKAEKWLDHRKVTHNVSLQSELNYWKKYLKQVKKGSDAWYEIQKKINDLNDQIAAEKEKKNDDILNNASKYVSRQKRLYGMTYAQERDYWAKVLKKLKKGTSQYQEAWDNWYEAKKEAAEEIKEKNADLLDAEQSFVDKLRDIQQQLTEDIQEARDAYREAVEDRKQTILDDFNVFERYRKKMTISGEKLIENIRSQVEATRDYETAMKQLEGRIGKGDLYDEIASMGMEGLRYAESLNKMTEEQLKEFTSLFEERNKTAQREATRESADLLAETNATIKNLNEQAAKDIKAAANELKKTAADLGTDLAKTVSKMASNVKASASSITSSINSAISSLKKLDSRVSTTSSSAKTYAAQGSQVPIAYNGRQVITDSSGNVQGYSLMATDLYGATRQTELSITKGMEALTMAFRDSQAIGGDTFNDQTINFNVPVSSPDEIARTMRMQQHYGLAGRY